MIDYQSARSYFPYIETGRIYFNHASTGPLSTLSKKYVDERIELAHLGEIDDYLKFLDTLSITKSLLSKYLNGPQDRFGFCDNTTTGINILANSFPFQEDDEIILNDAEFPANVYPFTNLEQKGVKIKFVRNNNLIVTADQIISAITPKTRLISVSFVQFLSGYKVDLEEIGKVCKEKNIYLCVDAIQGLGALTLDIKKCNISFLSSGVQKWMLGLQGLAFYYISEELQNQMHPAFAGWLAVEDEWNLLDYNLKFRKTADIFQTGTLNTIGIFALRGSLELFNKFSFTEIEKRIIANSVYFNECLNEKDIQSLTLDCRSEELSGITTIKIPEVEKTFSKLVSNKISCSLREGYLRFSPHFYNTKEEINKVVSLL